MRLALILIALPGAALAHPGHIAETAGHDHWIAGAAIGLAIAVAVWAALKSRKKDKEPEIEAEDEADAEETTA